MPTTNEENRAEKNNETTERARASRHNKLIVEQTVQTESEPTASGSSCVINPECVVNRGEPCQEDLIPIQDNRSIMKAKDRVTVKEEGVDEGMVERMADVCIGERSNSRTSPWTHEDSGDPKTR
ncbi:uncharacterized protein [Epargyreus clarus]|uniref:uncharacterized protein n=1 Tax=Epargyreus clarus TaxID=520877 RepID=UPI003C2CDAD9